MKCDYCDDPATIFLSQLTNEKLKKICLCESCSKNKEIIEKEQLNEILQQTSDESPASVEPEPSLEITCECGFTMNDLTKTGRLGCPKCYVVFENVLSSTTPSIESLLKKKNKLSSALDNAIENEEFEKAAQVRDEMSSLNEKIAQL